jgi:hypothetical protein
LLTRHPAVKHFKSATISGKKDSMKLKHIVTMLNKTIPDLGILPQFASPAELQQIILAPSGENNKFMQRKDSITCIMCIQRRPPNREGFFQNISHFFL